MPAPQKNSLADLKQLLDLKKPQTAPQVLKQPRTQNKAKSASDEHPSFAQTFAPLKRTVELTETEIKLFRKSVEGVMPLKKRDVRVQMLKRPPPIPRQLIKDEAAALLQANEAKFPSPMSWDLGVDLEDDQSFLRAGANPDLLRKLRRGLWVTQGELDLHHHTQDEAHAALGVFMAHAAKNEWRCVRIVHGKGLTSVRREPVLRGKVRHWLQMRDDVMAYCEPRPNGGGSGAVLVLLQLH